MRVVDLITQLEKEPGTKIKLCSTHSKINQALEPYDNETACHILLEANKLIKSNPSVAINIHNLIDSNSLHYRKMLRESPDGAEEPIPEHLGDLLSFNERASQLTYRCQRTDYVIKLDTPPTKDLDVVQKIFHDAGDAYQKFDDSEAFNYLLNLIKKSVVDAPEDRRYLFRRDPPLLQDKSINTSKTQRRYDALAKLLSVNNKTSPCVAVTMFNKRLVISANPPKPVASKDDIILFLQKKIEILREFLTYFPIDETTPKKTQIINHAQYSINELVSRQCGGIAGALVNNEGLEPQAKYAPTHAKTINSLVRSLLKLRVDFLTDKGQIKDLCDAIFLPFLFVKGNKFGEHAEQLIIKHLFSLAPAEVPQVVIHIGINKQCCYDCAMVMNEFSSQVSVRGYTLNKFPGVIRRNECVIDRNTANFSEKSSPSHPDSASEPEFDENLEDEFATLRQHKMTRAELDAIKQEARLRMRDLPTVPRIIAGHDGAYNVRNLVTTRPFPSARATPFFFTLTPTGVATAENPPTLGKK